MRIRSLLLSAVLIMLTVWFDGCDIKEDNPLDTPHADQPIIDDIRAYPSDPFAGSLSLVIARARNPLNDSLAYEWNCLTGEFLRGADRDSAIWRAPDTAGIAELSVTVRNSRNAILRNIYLLVLGRPNLAIGDRDSLNFGASGDSLQFTVINTGDPMSWEITSEDDRADWIRDIRPVRGVIGSGQQQQVTVEVTREGLGGGSYTTMLNLATTSIQIDTLRAVDSLRVLMDVAELLVDVDTLRFGAKTLDLDFQIHNRGRGYLTWDIREDARWLTVQPAADSTAGDAVIQVIADRDYLYQPEASAPILVNTNGGTVSLTATITKLGPIINVAPESLHFGPDDLQAEVDIYNRSGEILSWRVETATEWLAIQPATGSTAEWETTPIVVFAHRGSLTPGDYEGGFTIISNGGIFELPVTMTAEGPLLKVEPDSLDFGDAETMLPLVIRNDGTEALDWEVTNIVSWALPQVLAGSTRAAPDTLKIGVNRMGLETGVHEGTLEIASNGGSKTIFLSVEVPFSFKVAPDTLDFGEMLSFLSFKVLNEGSRPLDWSIANDLPWVTNLLPDHGRVASGSAEVTVGIDRASLDPGDYSGTLVVSSPLGTQPVTLRMTVRPILSLNTHNLDFDTSFTERRFFITNAGNGTLRWTVECDAPWIASISPAAGEVNANAAEVVVSVDRDRVESGEYSDRLIISSNGGQESIDVRMEVPPRGMWLKHDDGSFESQYQDWSGFWGFVRFKMPEGWSGARARQVEIITRSGETEVFNIDGFDRFERSGGLIVPSGEAAPLASGVRQAAGSMIYNVDAAFTAGNFFIALKWLSNNGPALAVDETRLSESFSGAYNGASARAFESGQFGIRVYAEEVRGAGRAVWMGGTRQK